MPRLRPITVRKSIAVIVTAILAAGSTLVHAEELEEITVTAQKREAGLQSTSVAISAFSGENIKKNRIFSASDLAASAASL